MKKSILWILSIIILTILFIGIYFLYDNLKSDYSSPNISGGDSTEAAQSAPDFTVINAEGDNVSLSDYFGKPIVLNFWASWCPPCKEEMPHFEKAYKEYPDITFLMVNCTTSDRESLDKAKAHIKENNYTFPVLYDTDGIAAQTYRTYSLPTTYFIDKDGNLVTYATGMLSYETLTMGIDMIK